MVEAREIREVEEDNRVYACMDTYAGVVLGAACTEVAALLETELEAHESGLESEMVGEVEE